MPKLILDNIGSFSETAVGTINSNNDRIETALENTLSRDGSAPNQMEAALDMNHHDILNADTVHTDHIVLNGELLVPETELGTVREPVFFSMFGDGSYGPYDIGEEITVASTIAVFVDGAYMAPDTDFSFDGSEITFSTLAPSAANRIQGYIFAARELGIATAVSNNVAREFMAVTSTRSGLKSISPTRHLGAYLTEGGREGAFVWDPTVTIATHQADTQEGIYVAPNPTENGAWRRLHGTVFDLRWWGLQTGNFDNEPVWTGAFNYIKAQGNNHLGSAVLTVPAGRYQSSPVVSDIQGVQIVGAGKFATELNAFNASQSVLFHFTSQGTGSVRMKWLYLNGWRVSAELTNYPFYGVRFDGGSNHFEEMRIYRCRYGIWGLRGNFNRFRDLEIGFFDGAGIRLGHVNSPSSTISENRITRCSIFSGAASHGGGDGTYAGSQIELSTNCAATIIENSEGGSTLYGIRVYDGVGQGESFAPGHVFLRDYSSGNCRDAGLFIQHNGGFVNAVNCSFSAPGSVSGDGVLLNSTSTNGSVRLVSCSFHECRRSGVYVGGGRSVWVSSSIFRAVGNPDGSGGFGFLLNGGSAKAIVQGCVFDQDFQANASGTGRLMNYGIRANSTGGGTIDEMGNYFGTITANRHVTKAGASTTVITRYQYNVTTL